MKKHFASFILLALITLCFVCGCKKVSLPATCVSAMSDSVSVGQSVTFSSCTQGATAYLWDFGDGFTATTATAMHTYTIAGIYIVTFTPSNSSGVGSTQTFTMYVVKASLEGGSWAFKQVTYTTVACVASGSALTATNYNTSNASGYGTVQVLFYNALPTVNGTYNVSPAGAALVAGHVGIYATTGGTSDTTYASTGGNGIEYVYVTVINGKVTVAGSGVEMLNTATASIDSAVLNLSITQTQ
jgi:PKD repeat protein